MGNVKGFEGQHLPDEKWEERCLDEAREAWQILGNLIGKRFSNAEILIKLGKWEVKFF